MAKRIIEISVNDEYVLGSGVVIGAAGSHNDVILRVTFNESWDGLYKYATFRDSKGENPVVVMITVLMLEDGTLRTYNVPVSAAAERYAGQCSVTFSGFTITSDGNGTEVMDTATNSATAKFRVLPSEYSFIEDEVVKAGEIVISAAELQELVKNASESELAAENSAEAAASSAEMAAETLGFHGEVVLEKSASYNCWKSTKEDVECNIEIEGLRENDAVFFSPRTKEDENEINYCEVFVHPEINGSTIHVTAVTEPRKTIALTCVVVRGSAKEE